MCFKASQYGNYLNYVIMNDFVSLRFISVGGTYITVRGCAPFDSETFNLGMQRQMVGTYWKGFNVFSLCDYDQCNSGPKTAYSLALVLSLTFFLRLTS